MRWYFSPQLLGQVETEVTQRDQFSNDELELSETIVRESIQNSLDAAIGSLPVRVTFRWVSKSDGLDSVFIKDIFEGQLVHAEEAGLDIGSIDFDNPTALVIEDFGTKGLTGSIDSKDDDNFSDFWRRHGKSHKTGSSRGRWGLGKLVYSTASQLGVFYGATLRVNDPQIHIMGQTVLNLRTVSGIQYPPHGFFADIDGEDLLNQIPVPIKDPELVEMFNQQFTLERSNNPGLSVIIPFPNPDFSREKMIGLAIENYFYPILTEQLKIHFDEIEINKSNIRELAKHYSFPRFEDTDVLFNFIEEAHERDISSELHLLHPSWIDDGALDEKDFDEGDLEIIKDDFATGKLVAVRLPVSLKKKDGSQVDTWFSVCVKRPLDLKKGMDLYVRGGLTLPGEEKFKERKALGVMIAKDEAICSFLGDAENASHSHWIGSAEKLRANYQNPNKTIQVIKNSIVQLYDLLADEVEEIDEYALSSFFWKEESQTSKKKKKPKKTPVVVPKPPEPRPKDFRINEIGGGFSIIATSEISSDRLPITIRIEAAYDVVNGNPYKKYSSHDFKWGRNGNINFTMTANKTAKIISHKENVLKLEITGLPFHLKATGFDENRDLKIKVTREGSEHANNH